MSERLIIKHDELRADSETDSVRVFRGEFDEAKVNKRVVVVKRCPDSRLVDPRLAAVIGAIASGGPNSPFTGALESPYFEVAAAVNHYDGETIRNGGIPAGCGGRDGKRNGISQCERGIGRFLDKHVQDDDLIFQTLTAMSHVSFRAGGKSTVGAVVNQRNLVMYPVGFVEGGHAELPSPIGLHNLMKPEYFPIDRVELYKSGIPTINPALIHPRLREFLADYRRTQARFTQKYKKYNLHQMQASQDPDVIFLTSELRPPRDRFPSYFEAPGTYFHVTLAINDKKQIDEDYLQKEVLDQLDYPFGNFTSSNLIIETRSIDTSAAIAKRVVESEYAQKWRERKDTVIILLETAQGITYNSDVYKPAV